MKKTILKFFLITSLTYLKAFAAGQCPLKKGAPCTDKLMTFPEEKISSKTPSKTSPVKTNRKS